MVRRKKITATAFTRIFNQLLKEHGLTISQASKIAKIPQSTLGDWRSGTQPNNFEAAQRLADHFNVSLGFLLTGQEDKRGNSSVPPITAVFDDGGLLFDGYAKITIQRLTPRQNKGGGENEK